MTNTKEQAELVELVRAGNRRAIARVMTLVENRAPVAGELLAELHHGSSRSYLIGVTGPPGAGKSTLVMCLAREYRRQGKTVGIIAVDPTSPYTGGAILGDRVRMQSVMTDPEVFIRSMATRGQLGGLAEATIDAARVLEAAGKEIVIIETVGAGQSEVDVASAAHTTLVVEVPGMGDDVQAIKAGIMEIADIFVINKADLDNVERLVSALELVMRLGPPSPWTPPIVKVVATKDEGITELVEQISAHRQYLIDNDLLRVRDLQRTRFQLLALTQERLMTELEARLAKGELESIVTDINERRTDPYYEADRLVKRLRVL